MIKRIISIILLSFLILTCLNGCIRRADIVPTDDPEMETVPDEPVREIVLTSKYLGKCGISADEWIEAHNKNEYSCYSIREDGALLIMVTERQLGILKTYSEEMIQDACDTFSEEDPEYHIDVSDDHKRADFYYYPDMDHITESSCMTKVFLNCIALQIYEGCEEDTWNVEINIYNVRTGKLVTTGGTETDIHYSIEDWK